MKQLELFNDLTNRGAFNSFNNDTLSEILDNRTVLINSIFLIAIDGDMWLLEDNPKTSYLKLNKLTKVFNIKEFDPFITSIESVVVKDNSQEYSGVEYMIDNEGWAYIKLTNLPEEITSTVDIAITYHIFVPE